MTPRSTRDWIAVLWPAFIAACLTEIVVFGCFDPADFHFFGSQDLWSAQSVYSIAFFCFWLIAAIATLSTWNLGRSARQINEGTDDASDPSAANP
ncbi:MAG: hypothetical protein AB7P21_00845 [Lautropia sp.]